MNNKVENTFLVRSGLFRTDRAPTKVCQEEHCVREHGANTGEAGAQIGPLCSDPKRSDGVFARLGRLLRGKTPKQSAPRPEDIRLQRHKPKALHGFIERLAERTRKEAPRDTHD